MTHIQRDTDGIRAAVSAAIGHTDTSDRLTADPEEGVQATVYMMTSGRPRVPGHLNGIALKLFRADAGSDCSLPRRQFELLSMMHTALNGRRIHGWTVFTPAPLEVLDSPPALMMSVVPGVRLSSWLSTAVVPRDIFGSLPRAMVSALDGLWSAGELHGDLSLDNILCDPVTHRCSLVDPGLRGICMFGKQASAAWSPATHDLTHLIYDLLVATVDRIRHPIAYRRKWRFAQALVQAFVEHCRESAEAELNGLRSCIRSHLLSATGTSSAVQLHHTVQSCVGLLRLPLFFDPLCSEGRPS